MYTDSSLGFINACEELNWNHERSTPRRSDANGLADRAVRRLTEGTFVSIGSVWIARKLVGRSHGVSLLSPKCARSIGWWPETLWTSVLFTIWRAEYSIWSRSKHLSNIIQRPRSSPSVRHKSLFLEYSLDTPWTREGGVGLVFFW